MAKYIVCSYMYIRTNSLGEMVTTELGRGKPNTELRGGEIQKRASGVIVSEWKRSVRLGRGASRTWWNMNGVLRRQIGPRAGFRWSREATFRLTRPFRFSVFSRTLIIPSFPSLRPYHLPRFIFGSPVAVSRTDCDGPLYIIIKDRRRRRYSLCDRLTKKRIFISSLSHHRQVVFP